MRIVNYAENRIALLQDAPYKPDLPGELKRLAARHADYQQPLPNSARKNDSRPTLPAPTKPADMDVGTLLLRLAEQKQTSGDLQLQTIAEAMKTSQEQAKQASDERVDKMLTAIKERAEQNALSRANSILGWLGKIASVVMAVVTVVATAATFGAAAPLAVIAIAGAAYAVTDLALDIVTEASGEDVRMGTLITKAVEQAALLAGHSAEKAAEIAQWSAMAIQIYVAVGTSITSGVCLTQAAAKAATMAVTKATAMAMKAGQIVQRGAQAVSATTRIPSGGLSIAEGISKQAQAKLHAAQLELQAVTEEKQMEMDAKREDMKKLLEEIQLISQIIASSLSNLHAAKSKLIRV